MKEFGICICGFGIVGSGTYEILQKLNAYVVSIFDLPTNKRVPENLLVSNLDDVINDKRIDCIVECLGHEKLPYELITRALKAGKSVVTSNKETVSNHFEEYVRLSKENHCHFLYEASVGGGMPVLSTLKGVRLYEEILGFYGIFNGTTNFVLGEIFDNNKTMDEAIKEAQRLGFAESDPTDDLEGNDLLRKGYILGALAFDHSLEMKNIARCGIKNLSQSFIDEVKRSGKIMKFLLMANKESDGIHYAIVPTLVSPNSRFNVVKKEYNAVLFKTKYHEDLFMYGKGAGKYPTGSAIVEDVERIREGVDDLNSLSFSATPTIPLIEADYLVEDWDGRIFRKHIIAKEEFDSYKLVARFEDYL
ncbi:MAG: homoserine dehydrogenase [Bacilli bacterium]|nr:homoserine dehydrogenase [Bacilli bacterium]